VENPTRQPIDQATRNLIDKLLLERLALAAIARVTGLQKLLTKWTSRLLSYLWVSEWAG
jgi:hypothetical protein